MHAQSDGVRRPTFSDAYSSEAYAACRAVDSVDAVLILGSFVHFVGSNERLWSRSSRRLLSIAAAQRFSARTLVAALLVNAALLANAVWFG
jgi:hypothetical protein